MALCAFQHCINRSTAFSKIAFFNLPRDDRRAVWITNSGNPDLRTLSQKSKRLVCEEHFEPKYLRKQFHRTTLTRDAIPTLSAAKQLMQRKEKKISNERVVSTSDDNQKIIINLSGRQYMVENNSVDNDVEFLSEDDDVDMKQSQQYDTDTVENQNFIVQYEDVASTIDDMQQIDSYQSMITVDSDRMAVLEVVKTVEETGTQTDFKPDDSETNDNANESEIHDSTLESHRTADVLASEQENEFLTDLNVDIEAVPSTSGDTGNDDEEPPTKKIVVQVNSPPTTPIKEKNAPEFIEKSPLNSPITNTIPPPVPQKTFCEEEHFALSLVGPLQRLPAEKRAMAKVKILTYLVKLECGLNIEDI